MEAMKKNFKSEVKVGGVSLGIFLCEREEKEALDNIKSPELGVEVFRWEKGVKKLWKRIRLCPNLKKSQLMGFATEVKFA